MKRKLKNGSKSTRTSNAFSVRFILDESGRLDLEVDRVWNLGPDDDSDGPTASK